MKKPDWRLTGHNPYQMPRLPDLQVGRLNWVTANYQGERYYVLALVGEELQNAECRLVSKGWDRHPTNVLPVSELEPNNCQDVEGCKAGEQVKTIWKAIGGQ